ncbi:MAG: ATP-binding protein [Gemmatimonadaceae bacterium]|nr:ATP-binding protein [Gemmatimonadaceae bacterium]
MTTNDRQPLRIVLTGSESVGKTTLAADLAAHYGVLAVPEFVREFAQSIGRPIVYDDLITIARSQVALEEAHLERARALRHTLLMHDTDPISTVVYAHHYFGGCPEEVEALAISRIPDRYLLLDIDVPWVPDGVRDRGEKRTELQQLFEETLVRLGAPISRIHGSWSERRTRAIAEIDHLLSIRN